MFHPNKTPHYFYGVYHKGKKKRERKREGEEVRKRERLKER